MATIEPRLIHLLNDPTSSRQLQTPDLPPLQALPLPSSAERSLPPIEAIESDGPSRPPGASGYPLRSMFDRDGTESMSPKPRSSDDAYNNKRSRDLHPKDDLFQLPQPMKRQKSAQQAPAMPPIINGLLEPPPHAALFPPIDPTSYDDSDSGNIRLLQHAVASEDRSLSPVANKVSPGRGGRSRKKAARPRKKWTEEETRHLLLGVSRHGVGKWTSILDDPDFIFNDRSAGDLKDRFRTCCPEELWSSSKPSSHAGSPSAEPTESTRYRSRTGLHSENVLIEDSSSPPDVSVPFFQPKKSRAHRKRVEDLVQMGIQGPFKKSRRRERRPFTDRDDREILEGLHIYGPAWTKIQRHEDFQLSTRQPTDLRDRVRNKYPDIYQCIEKGSFNSRVRARGGIVLEPSVIMSIDTMLERSKTPSKASRSSRDKLREEQSHWALQVTDSAGCGHPPQDLDLIDVSNTNLTGSEMGISRLLLDDPRDASGSSRPGVEHSPTPSSPSPIHTTESREWPDKFSRTCRHSPSAQSLEHHLPH